MYRVYSENLSCPVLDDLKAFHMFKIITVICDPTTTTPPIREPFSSCRWLFTILFVTGADILNEYHCSDPGAVAPSPAWTLQ